jgi:hypothetical protein
MGKVCIIHDYILCISLKFHMLLGAIFWPYIQYFCMYIRHMTNYFKNIQSLHELKKII